MIVNRLLNFELNNSLWLLFMRRISRFFKIYFTPSILKKLPKNNHPLINLEVFFTRQYKNFKRGNFFFNKDLYKNLKKNFKYNQKIKVLDFGGENIDLYLFLKKKFPKIEISVINQLKINKYLLDFIKKKNIKGVKIFSNIEKISRVKFDFVYFGSSLQYIKDYDKILKFLFKKKIKYICISATSYFKSNYNADKIILKQVNLLPIRLYCYSFNYNYILKFFSQYGYSIIRKKINPYKKINFKNFPFEIKYLNILFKKKIQ